MGAFIKIQLPLFQYFLLLIEKGGRKFHIRDEPERLKGIGNEAADHRSCQTEVLISVEIRISFGWQISLCIHLWRGTFSGVNKNADYRF